MDSDRDAWQSAVFTLIGHAEALREQGQRDMPAWLYGLAERIARAHLDEAHAQRVQQVAAAAEIGREPGGRNG